MKISKYILTFGFAASMTIATAADTVTPAIIYSPPLEAPVVEVGVSPTAEAVTVEETVSHAYSGISLSASEKALLERVVAAEAQDTTFDARVAVVEVIFNRVLSKDWPNTVQGVLSQKGQFDGYKYRNASWVEPSYGAGAVNYVLENGRTLLPGDYVYFATKKQSYAKDHIKIGAHWYGR